MAVAIGFVRIEVAQLGAMISLTAEGRPGRFEGRGKNTDQLRFTPAHREILIIQPFLNVLLVNV